MVPMPLQFITGWGFRLLRVLVCPNFGKENGCGSVFHAAATGRAQNPPHLACKNVPIHTYTNTGHDAAQGVGSCGKTGLLARRSCACVFFAVFDSTGNHLRPFLVIFGWSILCKENYRRKLGNSVFSIFTSNSHVLITRHFWDGKDKMVCRTWVFEFPNRRHRYAVLSLLPRHPRPSKTRTQTMGGMGVISSRVVGYHARKEGG